MPEIEPFAYCQCCGKPITNGRMDRKFCDERCRNRYHNRKKYLNCLPRQLEVWSILKKNREILSRLESAGVTDVELRSLENMGYRPEYVTYSNKISRRQLYGCFEYMYELVGTRIIRLSATDCEPSTSK